MSPEFVDSHCHLDYPDLYTRLDDVLKAMAQNNVVSALCPAVNTQDLERVMQLIDTYPHLYGAIALHPGEEASVEPTAEDLIALASPEKIRAIGETGLDYHYYDGDLTWQHKRFIAHIEAAKVLNKPLVIHCREAAGDVLKLLKENGAQAVGGVMHCFSETLEIAQAAMDLGFYISFSGVITFKNAQSLRDVARQIPLNRLLIETDSPYLAPVPYRGKPNQPAYVVKVAEKLAEILDLPLENIAQATTRNYCQLFKVAPAEWRNGVHV